MGYKVYYHRYGQIEYFTEETAAEAKKMMGLIEGNGDGFGDCIVDENEIIIHDFDSDTEVIGRKQPVSRIGQPFRKPIKKAHRP